MDANGNFIPPFAIENGVVKIINARIGGANIDNLLVKGEQIEPGAVTSVVTGQGVTYSGQGASQNVDIQCTYPENAGDVRILFDAQAFLSSTVNGGGARGGVFRMVNIDTGATLKEMFFSSVPPFATPVSWRYLITPPSGSTSTRLRLYTSLSTSNTSWETPTAIATVLKR